MRSSGDSRSRARPTSSRSDVAVAGSATSIGLHHATDARRRRRRRPGCRSSRRRASRAGAASCSSGCPPTREPSGNKGHHSRAACHCSGCSACRVFRKDVYAPCGASSCGRGAIPAMRRAAPPPRQPWPCRNDDGSRHRTGRRLRSWPTHRPRVRCSLRASGIVGLPVRHRCPAEDRVMRVQHVVQVEIRVLQIGVREVDLEDVGAPVA